VRFRVSWARETTAGIHLVAMTHLTADGWRARAYLVARKKDLWLSDLKKPGVRLFLQRKIDKLSSLNAFLQTADHCSGWPSGNRN